jgi:hypothetical protein
MSFRLLFPALVATWVAGCAGEIDVPQTGNVIVMHVEPGVGVTVETDRLVFPAAGNSDLLVRVPGDVLVSDVGEGFLRRVVSIELAGDSIIVGTSDADLAEIVGEGRVRQELRSDEGKRDGAEGTFAGFDVQLTGAERLTNDADLSIDLVRGRFQFAPDLEIDAIIRERRLDQFRVAATGALDSLLVGEIAIAGKVSKDVKKKLWSQKHVSVQLLGEIPVVEVIELSVGVGIVVEGEGHTKVRLTGRAAGTMSAGAEYLRAVGATDGEWHSIAEQELVFTPELEVLEGDGKIAVAATVFAQIEVRFYDAIGPAIRLSPFVEMAHAAHSPDWTPSVGLRADFEALVKIPFIDNKYWKPYRAQLFDLRKVFDPVQPGGPVTPAPTCGDVTAQGFCTEGIAIRCTDGALAITDCAAEGLGCVISADHQIATCAPGCGQLDYQGACADGSLRWCDAGRVRTYECPADGPGCGWVDDTIGYNCL